MRKWWLLLIFFCLPASGMEAAASIYGSTGLIGIPTADVIRKGQFFSGYYHLEEGDYASLGMELAKGLEVALWTAHDGFTDGRQVAFSAKYALRQEEILIPGIAVGIEDIGDKEARSPYVVASKALPFGIRVHAGYGGGRYDGVFYGVEKSLTGAPVPGVFPDASLIVEYDGADTNYGVRLALLSGWKVNAGWRRDDPYVGVTYNFY